VIDLLLGEEIKTYKHKIKSSVPCILLLTKLFIVMVTFCKAEYRDEIASKIIGDSLPLKLSLNCYGNPLMVRTG